MIKSVNPKGDQSWVFIGRTDAEAEAAVLWPPDAKSWLIGKDSGAGKNRGQEGKGITEMFGWHHWLKGCEFEKTPRDGERQGSLVCCSPWGFKELDTTEWLNNSQETREDRGAWCAIVYGVTKSQTQLSDLATYPLLTVQGQKAVLSEVIQAPGLLLWLVCSFLGCDPLLHGGSSCPLLSPYHSLYRWEQLLYASFLTSHLLELSHVATPICKGSWDIQSLAR